jgi:hypothetical protein
MTPIYTLELVKSYDREQCKNSENCNYKILLLIYTKNLKILTLFEK